MTNPIVNLHSPADITAVTSSNGTSSFLEEQEYIAFDTETTGLWAPAHRIVEIAAVRFRPRKRKIETFQALVNPGISIPKEVIDIHGITDEMVASAKSAGPVIEKFLTFCRPNSILIAHNAMFDISFLSCEMRRYSLDLPMNRILDTVDLCRRCFPGKPSYSLLSLAKSFRIARTQEHRALADAIIVRRLFLRALPKLPELASFDQLGRAMSVYSFSSWQDEATSLPPEFKPLEAALGYGGRIEIEYISPRGYRSHRIIHPKALHRKGKHLYVSAFCERTNEERVFRLDRISAMNVPSN